MTAPDDRNSPSPWERPAPDGRTPAGSGLSRVLAIVAVLLGLTVLVVWLTSENPGSLDDRDSQIDFTRHLAWLAVVLPALALCGRYRMRAAVRDAMLWLAVAGVLVVGYSYRAELSSVGERVMGELAPRRGVMTEGGTVAFRPASDGHFHVDAMVDGTPIRFMVDTGASDVVLNAADARRLGFDLQSLRFIRSYRTANGPVSGAPITLNEIRIGPIALRNIHASVNGGELDHSLLGMSFLGRLSAYGVESGTLTLHQ